MLNSSTLARSHTPFPDIPIAAVCPTPRNPSIECYLEGWAKADAAIIGMAVIPGYRFHDPLVGTFSRRSLHEYFAILQDRLSGSGEIELLDTAFFLRGPVDLWLRPVELRLYREAPRIGLTGISRIKVAKRGVVTETVEYDLNLASDMLRAPHRGGGSVDGNIAPDRWRTGGNGDADDHDRDHRRRRRSLARHESTACSADRTLSKECTRSCGIGS
jgi:hypothetical protein